ncbi:MAG TPA: L,D-transpeptidase family protein [Rhizomicrobium sp.]|jgi:hypothetical protein
MGWLRYLIWLLVICAAGPFCAPAVMAAAAPVEPSPVRISYPAGHYPELRLPDGRHVAVHSLLNITRPMHFGDFVWNEANVPQGAVWVRVDLSRQILSVFRDGHEIGSAVILYGSDHTPTPVGRFPILEKNAHYYSHTYQVPMPYMLRLTNDGVAIHASSVREGWATHGCIGVPPDFARLLFTTAGKGTPVDILPAR